MQRRRRRTSRMDINGNPKDWLDWERVLVAWRLRTGHHGLTLQALAEITQRDPLELWKEIKVSKVAGGSYCSMVKAPVICIRISQDDEYYIERDGEARWKIYKPGQWLGQDESEDLLYGVADAKKAVLPCLEAWPWPMYKGISRGEGVKSFTPAALKSVLVRAATGVINPCTGKAME